MVRQIVVGLAVIAMGIVLGASVYNSVVDARSWGANIPESLSTAQHYFTVVNPGTFFRVASPLAQLLALLALIVCWKVPGARVYAGTALTASILGDVMTFAYFYPRNAIIMGGLARRRSGGPGVARMGQHESRAECVDARRSRYRVDRADAAGTARRALSDQRGAKEDGRLR